MSDHPKLLTPPHNFAIVQLPTRKFPGVVIQGDTLHTMIADIERIQSLLDDEDLDAAKDELAFMKEGLSEALQNFESACALHSIALPYVRRAKEDEV